MAFREEKKLKRWIVFQLNPWAIVAFFATEAEARTKALELGAGHIVQVCKKRRSSSKGAKGGPCKSGSPKDRKGEQRPADMIGNTVIVERIVASMIEDEVATPASEGKDPAAARLQHG